MISLLRKEACSGSVHDLAHISTRNCLTDCVTKVSGKADNLITAVKTGGLLDVDIHPNLRTHGAEGLLDYLVQNMSVHKGARYVLPVAVKSSLARTVKGYHLFVISATCLVLL